MQAQRRFPDDVLAAIRKSMIIGLRAGTQPHRFIALWGASQLLMAFINNLWLACGLLLLSGLMWGPYTPMETTLLQCNVPKA